MTSNYKLKQDCKATLNSIRELLSQEDRQKVEPHLRQILELTKGLVENAKVSPEEHEALKSQFGMLTKEGTRLSESNAVLRRDLEKPSKLKDALATLKSEKDFRDDMLTDVIFSALHHCAANGIGLIAKCGDSGVAKWIAERGASNKFSAHERRAFLAVCMMVTSVAVSDELISKMLAEICSIPKPNGTTRLSDAISSCFKLADQRGPSKDSEEDELWWLAVNGDSCAACHFPFRAEDVEVSPVPEQLLGFRTQHKQCEILQFLLTAPIEDVSQYMASLPQNIESGEVRSVRPRNPEPPQDSTKWSIKKKKSV